MRRVAPFLAVGVLAAAALGTIDVMQGSVMKVIQAPTRWWARCKMDEPIRYSDAYRWTPDAFAYSSERPRQVELFGRSSIRDALSSEVRLWASFPEGGGLTPDEVTRWFNRMMSIDHDAYLRDVVQRLALDRLPSDGARVERIVRFVQDAVHHDPIVAPPRLDPVLIFEMHKGRCAHVNFHALPALLNTAGFRTRRVRLPGHAALEVWYDGAWHFVDADMLKNGVMVRRPDGTVPDTAWLLQDPHWYELDRLPAWTEAYAYGGAPRDAAGHRVTGFVGHANPEDAGYPSSRFGAPRAFPPSPPELLASNVRTERAEIELRWGGSYDRDGDLSGYRVEIGTSPGAADVAVLRTADSSVVYTLPAEGTYWYRVIAVDQHNEIVPGTRYVPSEEGRVVYQSRGVPPAEFGINWPELSWTPEKTGHRPIDAALFDDGAWSGFQVTASDATGEAQLFNVPWFTGRALKMVDLSDDQFPGGSVDGPVNQRLEATRPLPFIPDGRVFRMTFDLWLERHGYGGTRTFSIVEVPLAGPGGMSLALVINQSQDQLYCVLRRAVAPVAKRAARYPTRYAAEWRHPLSGPEALIVGDAPNMPDRMIGSLAIEGRNAWRFSWQFKRTSDGAWTARCEVNGILWGDVDVFGGPVAIRLQSQPHDEVVYVFDNLVVESLP